MPEEVGRRRATEREVVNTGTGVDVVAEIGDWIITYADNSQGIEKAEEAATQEGTDAAEGLAEEGEEGVPA